MLINGICIQSLHSPDRFIDMAYIVEIMLVTDSRMQRTPTTMLAVHVTGTFDGLASLMSPLTRQGPFRSTCLNPWSKSFLTVTEIKTPLGDSHTTLLHRHHPNRCSEL